MQKEEKVPLSDNLPQMFIHKPKLDYMYSKPVDSLIYELCVCGESNNTNHSQCLDQEAMLMFLEDYKSKIT